MDFCIAKKAYPNVTIEEDFKSKSHYPMNVYGFCVEIQCNGSTEEAFINLKVGTDDW